MMTFKHPWFIAAGFLSAALLIIDYIFILSKHKSTLKFSSLHVFKNLPDKILKQNYLRYIIPALRILSVFLLFFALARPRIGKKNTTLKSRGIEIILTLDISGSMRAEDLKPDNRLGAAKKVLADFIKQRPNDRVGLVVFGSEAFLQCPLTLDHGVVLDFLDRIHFIKELENRTAIGMSLAKSVYHLKQSKSKSKIVILLSDGENNSGDIDPVTAAHLADTHGIKIYTIGIGKPGLSQVYMTQNTIFGPRKVPVKNFMDEEAMKKIANIGGGKYFNAQDTAKLKQIYETINRLEKSEIKSNQYMEYDEKFQYFLIAALTLILIEVILSGTRFRKIP